MPQSSKTSFEIETNTVTKIAETKIPDAKELKAQQATAAATEATTDAQKPNPIPAWVTQAYFIDILKADFKNFKQIQSFEVGLGTNAGDNYASVMLKIDISIELEDSSIQPASYMLKVSPAEGQGKAMLDQLNTFKKELLLYSVYIPQFEQVYKNVGIDIVFGPKSYKFSHDPGCDVVLLENLRSRGFKNADRLKGLDMEHTKCVLRKLAEFHAASALVYATEGDYPAVLTQGIYTEENRAVMEAMGEAYFGTMLACMKTYTGNEEYIHKLGTLKENFHDLMIELADVDLNGFNVLNHGDCWTNNIMFQYDSAGNVQNTYLIDYQVVKFGSPAQDLYYFLMSSPQLDIKLEQFDYAIHYYHENLLKNLRLLNYPKELPTLKQLHLDLYKFSGWACSTVTAVMSAVLLDATENASIDNMLADDDAGMALKQQLYMNPIYRKHAEAQLIWLNRRGLLDF